MRTFLDVSPSDVAAQIAAEHGLASDVDASRKRAWVAQTGESDWDFLSRLAESLGFDSLRNRRQAPLPRGRQARPIPAHLGARAGLLHSQPRDFAADGRRDGARLGSGDEGRGRGPGWCGCGYGSREAGRESSGTLRSRGDRGRGLDGRCDRAQRADSGGPPEARAAEAHAGCRGRRPRRRQHAGWGLPPERSDTLLRSGGLRNVVRGWCSDGPWRPRVVLRATVLGRRCRRRDRQRGPERAGAGPRSPPLADRRHKRLGAIGGADGGPRAGTKFPPEVGDEVLVAFEQGDLRTPTSSAHSGMASTRRRRRTKTGTTTGG